VFANKNNFFCFRGFLAPVNSAIVRRHWPNCFDSSCQSNRASSKALNMSSFAAAAASSAHYNPLDRPIDRFVDPSKSRAPMQSREEIRKAV
jgi:hypothetical protein